MLIFAVEMTFEQAKAQFIQTWGTIGSSWGINRTMAQIHALLLISPSSLCADQIMQELQVSRGNVNMNLRALIDWNLVHKELRPGERKEFFVAEKDMTEVVQAVIIQRKKRELEPLLKAVSELKQVDGNTDETQAFRVMLEDIELFARKADKTLDNLSRADAKWLMNTFFNLIK